MGLVILGALPALQGIKSAITFFRNGPRIFQKGAFLKNAASRDLSLLFKEQLEPRIQSTSILKRYYHLCAAGVLVFQINQQKNRLNESVLRMYNHWVYPYASPLFSPEPSHKMPRQPMLFIKKVQLATKNALCCLCELFRLVQMLMHLWDFAIGTEEERDKVAHQMQQALIFHVLDKMDPLLLKNTLQEQFMSLRSWWGNFKDSTLSITQEKGPAIDIKGPSSLPFINERCFAEVTDYNRPLPFKKKPLKVIDGIAIYGY